MELATLLLKVDATGAVRSVKELNTELDKTKKEAGEATEATSKLGTAMKVAAAAGVLAMAAALRKMVTESTEAQFAQAQLEAALKSTGGVARQNIKALNDHAAALQKMSTFTDEAVSSAQAILLTFTKIGGSTFPQATQAVVDLATRMGGDLKGAALQVGKALQDPTEGLTALRRSGVSFSDAQQEVIKNLAETNRLAEAQAMILKELQVEFGGSAAAARNTLGGALDAVKKSFGELFEVDKGQSSQLINALNATAGAIDKIGIALDGLTDIAIGLRLMQPFSARTTTEDATPLQITTARDRARFGSMGASPITITAQRPDRLTPLATRPRMGTLTRPGAMADRLGGAGNSAKGLAETILETDKNAMADKLRALTDAARSMAESAAMVTENFLRGVQGAFTGFFRNLFTDGISSFRGLMDSFKNLVLNTVAELASKRLMDSIFGGAGGAGGLLGKLSGGALLGIGVGAFALSKMFTGQKGPSYRMNNTPTYDANGMDPRQVAAREALAKNQGPSAAQVRSSVGSALQEGTAVRLFATFEAMRQSLANIESLLRAGAMGGGQSASGMDRILGTRSQSLRLAAGVAVVG